MAKESNTGGNSMEKNIVWNFSPRTDLAIEARELAQQEQQNIQEIDGVKK